MKEAWLWENQAALTRVTEGIVQASQKRFKPDPRKASDQKWLNQIDDDND